jgi:hypothetical protein
MSKLVDKLSDVSKTTVPAMGFRKAEAEEKKLSLLVLANVTGSNEDEVREVAALGVSAVVIDAEGLSEGALNRMVKKCSGLVTGLLVDKGRTPAELKASVSEIDFIILETGAPVSLYGNKELEKAGRVVKLDMETEASRLRSVNGLQPSVDAVLIEVAASSLKLEDIMSCRRIADHTGQPVIAAVNKPLSGEELMSLREAGIRGLLLPVETSVSDMKALIDAIGALPKPAKKQEKERGSVSLLPHLASSTAKKDEEVEPEDDD